MDRVENPYLNTLRLSVKMPLSVVLAVFFVHVISLFLPWLTAINIVTKLILSGFVMVSFCYYVFIYLGSSAKNQVTELILNSEDQWQVKLGDGSTYNAIPGKTQFVHPWLTIIFLCYDKSSHFFIFTPEVIDVDQFRRLRVRLRFKCESVNNLTYK